MTTADRMKLGIDMTICALTYSNPMMDCFASASQELRFMSDLCRSNGFEHSLKICDICGCGKEMKRPPKKAFLPGGL